MTLYTSPLKWVVMLAPLGFVLFLGARMQQMSVGAAQIAFWLFAAVMGVSLSSIFLVFTGQSITQIFFVTAATFGALSLWGYTTKRDISGWGSFLFMGVVGIVIAALVNLFLQSSALQFAISVIGVLVFAGLTAYDTQRIKDGYLMVRGDAAMVAKSAIMGALQPLPRLHQHVRHAAEPVRQPRVAAHGDIDDDVKGPARGALCFCGSDGQPRR